MCCTPQESGLSLWNGGNCLPTVRRWGHVPSRTFWTVLWHAASSSAQFWGGISPGTTTKPWSSYTVLIVLLIICLYPISVMCPMLFLQNESATRVTGATIGTSYSSLLLIIRRISGKHDHHMRTTKYYQIGGFRPNVRWYVITVVWLVVTIQGARFENDWNDKKIVEFLAGPSSPLHPSKDRPLELLLGARLLSLLNWKHFNTLKG